MSITNPQNPDNFNSNPNLDATNPADMVEITPENTQQEQQHVSSPPPPQQQQQQEQMIQIPESEYRKYLESSGKILQNRITSENDIDKHIITQLDNLTNAVQSIRDLMSIKMNIKSKARIPGEINDNTS